MVLLTRSFTSSTSSASSRMLSRSVLASSRSSLRSFHNVSRTPSRLRPNVQGCWPQTGLHQSLGAQQQLPASVRLLTTRREKVKVLAVLYDGGKHGEEVRSTIPTPFPNIPTYSTACQWRSHHLFPFPWQHPPPLSMMIDRGEDQPRPYSNDQSKRKERKDETN